MKKITAILTALALALCALTPVFAEENEALWPFHDISVDELNTTYTVKAAIDPDAASEDIIVFSVYGTDLYRKADVLALQPGDRIFVNNEEVTVKTVDANEYGVELNGGYAAAPDGVSLAYTQDDPEKLFSYIEDDYVQATMLGQIGEPPAAQVKVLVYCKDAEGNPLEGYDETLVAGNELGAFLRKLYNEEYLSFGYDITEITVVNNEVTQIRVDYAP